jgi:hypothetical protein
VSRRRDQHDHQEVSLAREERQAGARRDLGHHERMRLQRALDSVVERYPRAECDGVHAAGGVSGDRRRLV